ncbi:MAG TPA: ROK family protein [Armatimonadota bacterium]|nr:ROK family protein [Armatimonadota bacterium]
MSRAKAEAGSGPVWAIDLGGTKTKLGIVAADGEVIGEETFPTRPERSAESWAEEAAAALRGIAGRTRVDERSVASVGIGAPGPLNAKEGVLTNPLPNLPNWRGFAICAALTERTGKPAYLDNDANCAALSEQWLGAARGSDDVLVLTLGTGIGGGIIADGRLLHGFSDNAGELGHMSIDHHGPPCVCGSRGCIELYASAGATAERYRRKLEEAGREAAEEITALGVFEAAEAGDEIARATFAEVGYYLGAAVSSMVHAFNPEMVVVAGGMAGAARYYLETIRSVVKERIYPDFQAGLRIEVSPLGDAMGLLGAARLALMAAGGQ